jgi:hypothetical protein
MKKWETVGHIGVDTGTLIILDPAYRYPMARYRAGIEAWRTLPRDDANAAIPWHPVGIIESERDQTAAVVTTGLGDGVYPVEVRWENVPRWGRRVAEVRVRFLPHPELGYSTPW